jgi:chromosome segregation ATPase
LTSPSLPGTISALLTLSVGGEQDQTGRKLEAPYIPSALSKLRETLPGMGGGPVDGRVEEAIRLVGRVSDLMTLQQSLLEKQNDELRGVANGSTNMHSIKENESNARVEDLLARVRGQAAALNSRTVEMDELRSSFSEQSREIEQLRANLRSSQSSVEALPQFSQGEKEKLLDQLKATRHENVVLRTRIARMENESEQRHVNQLEQLLERHVEALQAQHAAAVQALEEDHSKQLEAIRVKSDAASKDAQSVTVAIRKMEEEMVSSQARERVALEQAAKVEEEMSVKLKQAREEAKALNAKAAASDAHSSKMASKVAQVTEERDRISAEMIELRAVMQVCPNMFPCIRPCLREPNFPVDRCIKELDTLKSTHEEQHKELIDALSKAANASNRAEMMAAKLNEGEKQRALLAADLDRVHADRNAIEKMLVQAKAQMAQLPNLEGKLVETQRALEVSESRAQQVGDNLAECSAQLEESRAAAEHMKSIIARMRDELGDSRTTCSG